MTVTEREACTVMAAILHAHRPLASLGLLMTTVVAAALMSTGLLNIGIETIALAVAVIALTIGATERYFAFRVRLDEKLFGALGNSKLTSTSDLDAVLLRLDLISSGQPMRPLEERLKGAAKLSAKHRRLVIIQFAAVIAFALMQNL